LQFIANGKLLDLSRDERYYIEDGSSRVSPSGNYLVINSVSGGYVNTGEEKKYTDRAYCSVVDMRNGCVVSDWDGEACGYDWLKGEDILAESESEGANTFNFISARPSITKIKKPLLSITSYEISNTLRCDQPSVKNIMFYQTLMIKNPNAKEIISTEIVNYFNSLKKVLVLNKKTLLYTLPSDDAKGKGYLISGDKVKLIQETPDKKWINIGYINPKGIPLITWIRN